MTLRIVHVDDDIQILDRFQQIFKHGIAGQQVILSQFEDASSLKKSLRKFENVDVFLLDVHIKTRADEGIMLASLCRKSFPNAAILMCSSSRDLKKVRDSLQMGADDYVDKDSENLQIIARVENSIKFKEQLHTSPSMNNSVVGTTLTALSIRIPHIIDSAINCVYIQGESGTGKEEVTRLFENAVSKGSSFIKINCGAIPINLIASELFGHSKGAFTGATSEKAGLIEAANDGWIFLDEVATLPMDAQVALLRAIENQTIRRVGSTKEKSVKFRVISATNEPIGDMVEKGKFRRDLWQRLRETQIDLPPLRDRPHEIPELVAYFCKSMRGGPYHLAPTVLDALCQYHWSDGNIRELRNCLRAMTEKAIGKTLTPNSIPNYVWQGLEKGGFQSISMGTRHEGTNSISICWESENRPMYDVLCGSLLLEILKSEFQKNGRMSMRAASKATGIPKSSMAAKLTQLIENNVITKRALNSIVQLSDGNSNDS